MALQTFKAIAYDSLAPILASAASARKRFDSISEEVANFTLASGDENVLHIATHAVTVIDVELPLHATDPIPLYSVYTVAQGGAAIFQFVGEGGVTVRGGEKSWEQYTFLNAVKIAENEWWIIGGES